VVIDVSEALCADNSKRIRVTRYKGGLYVDGVYQRGRLSSFTTLASVQPAKPRDLERLPEGERTGDAVIFVSKRELFTTDDRDNRQADLIKVNNKNYKIVGPMRWNDYGYCHSIGVRVNDP